MNIIDKTSLYYSEGSSDKEYHTEIVAVAGGNLVNFRYGRRGSALKAGTKTAAPVDLAQARDIYDKLVKEKIAKGYTADVSGVSYQGTDYAVRKTDFVPQLLNPLTLLEAQVLIMDNRFAAQEKMDGERRCVHAEADSVIGINRKGLVVPLPQHLADELQAIAATQGTLRVDGELIGEILYVFDLHIHHNHPLHTTPWQARMRIAEQTLAGCNAIKTLPFASDADTKNQLWSRVKAANGEGIVFKLLDSTVKPGRPNKGGDWLKFKFTESATCCVLGVNAGKRSVQLGLLESNQSATQTDMAQAPVGSLTPSLSQRARGKPISVGNVTIPINYAIPAAGEIVEVAYLYAYPGGSLFQPVYRGQRTDVDINDCITGQLKYKPA
ncbi:MAG: RNA ligase family protein [Gallionella sp.]